MSEKSNRSLTTAPLFIAPVIVALYLSSASAQSNKAAKSDEEIRQAIIKESIASYKGTCACPYSQDRAGRQCGRDEARTASAVELRRCVTRTRGLVEFG